MIKLLADENFHGDVLRGLMRHLPAFDLTRVQDVGLMWALPIRPFWTGPPAKERVLLTHDEETMPSFAYQRVRVGEPMPGVFLVHRTLSKGKAIEQLLVAIQCLEPADCQNLVLHFPY